MSEVIDAQVVDEKVVEAAVNSPAADPLAQLLNTPQRTEIVETQESQLSAEDQAKIEEILSKYDTTGTSERSAWIREIKDLFCEEY